MFLPLYAAAASSGWKHHGNFSQITAVVRHQQETWIAGHGGVARYNDQNQSLRFYDKVNSAIPSLMVEELVVHPQTGDIWIGTYDNGIARLSGNTFEYFGFPLPDAKLYAMCFTTTGKLFIANSRGVFEFLQSQNDWRPLLLVGPSSAAPCWDMDAMPDGQLACAGSQPFILNPDNDSISTLPASGIAYSNASIKVIDQQTLLFGTDHGVLSILENGLETDTFELEHPISKIGMMDGKPMVHFRYLNSVMLLENGQWIPLSFGNQEVQTFTTANDVVWAASPGENGKIVHRTRTSSAMVFPLRASGLNLEYSARLKTTESGDVLIANARPQIYQLSNRLFTDLWTTPFPSQVIEDVIWWNNRYLVGTSINGLWEYTSSGGWNRIGASELPGMNAENFTTETQRAVWFSGNGYLARYDGLQFQVYTELQSPLLPANLLIRDLYFDDSRGMLFAATYDGILTLKNGTFQRINETSHPQLHYYDAVQCIAPGPNQSVWFGSVYGGIIAFDGNDYTLEMLPVSTGNQVITDLLFDQDTLYVSDNLNGVWKKTNGSWLNWNDKNSPLASSSVRSMTLDREGNLWIYTTLGLDQRSASGVFQSVAETTSEFQTAVFPNPTTGVLNLQFPSSGTYTLQLTDLSGRIFIDKKVKSEESEYRMQLSDIQPGLYLLNVENEQKEKYCTRILVQ